MRIIGGSAKGTALLSPVGKGMTRPTLGRVRESIFNVLANVGMKDTRVLDIFAGTGAMGLEALSRGAAHATFLDKATCKLFRENAVKCHVENRADVLPGDVSRSLAKLAGNRYDYLFMDPPYGKGYIDQILALIFACRLPAENAIIIAEHSVEEPPDMTCLEEKCSVWKEKKVGNIVVTYLLCRGSEGEVS